MLKFLFVISIALVFSQNSLAQTTASYVDCDTEPRLKYDKSSRTISPGVFTGKARKVVKPEYSSVARDFNVTGVVNVTVLIDPRGCVHSASIISGHPFLHRSTIAAAMASAFYPITVGSKAVWVKTSMSFNFQK